MNRLNLSVTSTTVGLLPTSGTLKFMEDGYRQNDAAAIIAQIGSNYSTSVPYILYGCVATVSSPNTTITAGAIFYNGEVFTVPAQTFITASGGSVILCTITTANNYLEPDGVTNADPASYDDLSTHNTYDIRSITYTTGTTGSGTFDFSALTPIVSTSTQIASFGSPEVVTFNRSKINYYTAAVSGTKTITLDGTNAKSGASVTLILSTVSSFTIAFTSVGGQVYFIQAGTGSFSSAGFCSVEITFMGRFNPSTDVFGVKYSQ